SIIVAQRTRELALMRAIGGSRRQTIGSVMVEAVVIGLLASVLGLAAGIGIGTLLAYVFGTIGGGDLALAGVGVPASAVVAAFAGVALLTPVIARPVVSVLGRLLSWSLPGKLGRRNAARNPRRTAITAAALMVGVALVTGVNVVLASTVQSLHKQGDTMV